MDYSRQHTYAELYDMVAKKPKSNIEDIERFLKRENITSEECHKHQAPSPLCAAALINSPDLLKYFISLGFDPNAFGASLPCYKIVHLYPRHFPLRPIHTACCTVLHEDDEDGVEDDDEVKKRRKQASQDNLEVVRILVKDHNVDVNVQDDTNCEHRPLHYAAEMGRFEVVKLLVEAGADPTASDNEENYSPLHFAAMSGNVDVCQYLLFLGLFVDIKSKRDRRRPLHLAASKGAVDTVEILLDAGAKVNETDMECPSPLRCGSWSGNLDVVRLLVSRGANVQTDPKRDAMLIDAIENGDNDIVRYFLVEKGVCPNVTDCFNSTALFVAMNRENTTAAKILEACGCSLDMDDINELRWEDNDDEIDHLLDHFQMMNENPRKLQKSCYLKIRSLLGENVVESVNALQIPNAMKNVLLLKHVY